MEGRLAEVEEQLFRHKEHQSSSERREQELLDRIKSLEDELLTAGVWKDGMNQDKQHVRNWIYTAKACYCINCNTFLATVYHLELEHN